MERNLSNWRAASPGKRLRCAFAALASLAVCDFLLFANPVPDRQSGGPPLERQEANAYALQLRELTRAIADQYVRPVSRAELVTAALKGLYEEARVPVPRFLTNQVGEAGSSEMELQQFIARTRQSLGHPESLRGSRAVQASLRAIAEILDPYCAVLGAADLQRSRGAESRRGAGLELLDPSGVGPLVIKSVVLGGPAQKAGLRPGDRFTHIDGKPANDQLPVLNQLFQNAEVRLTCTGPNPGEQRDVTLKPELFSAETVLGFMRRNDNSWDYLVDDNHKIGLVRLMALDTTTPRELSDALTELRRTGMRGLILDLRWCPGGYLDQARDVVDLFMGDFNLTNLMMPTPRNQIAIADLHLMDHCPNAVVHYRDGRPDNHFKRMASSFVSFPVVILTNGDTSGGAELIAAVLQDNKRAFVAGQRTKGKASVQRIWRLNGEEDGFSLTLPVAGVGFKITNGILIRPSGRNLNRYPDSRPIDDWGVLPDARLEFRITPELSKQLQTWWQMQSLRPGTSSESYPVDDPAADPQCSAALQMLRGLVR